MSWWDDTDERWLTKIRQGLLHMNPVNMWSMMLWENAATSIQASFVFDEARRKWNDRPGVSWRSFNHSPLKDKHESTFLEVSFCCLHQYKFRDQMIIWDREGNVSFNLNMLTFKLQGTLYSMVLHSLWPEYKKISWFSNPAAALAW